MHPLALACIAVAALALGAALFLAFEDIEAKAPIRANRTAENLFLAMFVSLATVAMPAVYAMGAA